MSRLWKRNWFKNLCICAGTLAAIVSIAFITPPKQINNDTLALEYDSNQIAAVSVKDSESITHKDSEVSIQDDNFTDEFVHLIEDEQHVKTGNIAAAARWVDDEIVPMSALEIAEFEKQLYSCETKQEYKAIMEKIAYYNKDIDMSRFNWYGE